MRVRVLGLGVQGLGLALARTRLQPGEAARGTEPTILKSRTQGSAQNPSVACLAFPWRGSSLNRKP